MRPFLILIATTAVTVFGQAPAGAPELAEALKQFRAEPPPGWSYTLSTVGDGRAMVERSDAAKPEFSRWSLVAKDGRTPTEAEARDYAEGRTRRSRGGTAPRVIEQLDLTTLERISETPERATFACRLRPGDAGDTVAPHLRATIVVHRPSRTIEALELASTEEFSPTFGVRITAMNTRLTYSLPAPGRPTLPQRIDTRVRGRAFWFKSLDAEITMTFSDYAWAGKPGAAVPPPAGG